MNIYLSGFYSTIFTFKNAKRERAEKPEIDLTYHGEKQEDLHLMWEVIFH